ncbi:MAG: mannose-6-phosphate isomerase-like protein (cupin superfamily), partial [Bacteriovoracaceae bacterium]
MLGLFLFSGFKLFLEDQNPFLVGGSDFLAEIANLENTVKKKSGTHLAWNDAQDSQKLFDGDQLYTHENSEVDILFRDKTKINILENSLFKLERKEKEALIVLKEGIFYIRTRGENKKIKVKVANRELSIDSLESKLQVQGKGNDSKVIVLEGSATIGIGDQELELKPNQFIDFKEKENLDVQLIPIKLKSPLHNTTIFNQEKIQFNWELSLKKTAVFQISDDPSFKNLLDEKVLLTNSYSLDKLSKGIYYWRVLEARKSEAFEIRKLIVLEPIHIIGPLHSSLIRMKKPDSPVYFNWEGNKFDSYLIEVSSDKEFKNPLITEKIKSSKYIWEKAAPGQYF